MSKDARELATVTVNTVTVAQVNLGFWALIIIRTRTTQQGLVEAVITYLPKAKAPKTKTSAYQLKRRTATNTHTVLFRDERATKISYMRFRMPPH